MSATEYVMTKHSIRVKAKYMTYTRVMKEHYSSVYLAMVCFVITLVFYLAMVIGLALYM